MSILTHLTVRVSVVLLIALLTACGSSDKQQERALAEAWTGPVKLRLREEIHPQSKTAAEAKHGDKLEVLQIRRRFVRVRTENGKVGWTELRNLLSDEQMEALRDQSKRAAKLPSQGKATVYEPLNIHTEPSRPSTSFYQITEGMKVDVVAHRVVPRSNALPPPSVRIEKPKPALRKKKAKAEPAVPPPPKPASPAVPANWRELSESTLPPPPPESEEEIKKKAAERPKAPLEDWSLVRTKEGHAGWVLTRNLVMAIPDEVAQYSEGARITSYFPLAEVQDGEKTKHHWLWTTSRDNAKPYQFDSFRVFIYMLRRHRYETAYIERGIEGYYPVEVTHGPNPTFSLILRGPDGNLYRKTWMLEGYVVRKVGEELYKMPDDPLDRRLLSQTGEESEEESGEEDDERSLVDRMKDFFRRRT